MEPVWRQRQHAPATSPAIKPAAQTVPSTEPHPSEIAALAIAIRSGKAVPGPDLPNPGNADQLLSCWQRAFEDELGALEDKGGRILPGMLSMLAGQLGSVVFAVLKLLCRLPDQEWLDTGSLMSSQGADAGGAGTSIGDVFIIESTARVMKILSDFGADCDEATAIAQLLEAVPGADPGLAGRRVAAITVLTMVRTDDARAILREVAATGPDGRRHVAAGVLANLGEEPPLYRETTQQWLLIDLLTALSAGNLSENLTPDLMGAVRSHADDL